MMNIQALLAGMVVADGRIRPEERVSAEAYLDCFRAHYRLNTADLGLPGGILERAPEAGEIPDEPTLSSLLDAFEPLGRRDKLDLVCALWTIAICDGELHPREEALLYRFIDAAGLSRREANEAIAKPTRQVH